MKKGVKTKHLIILLILLITVFVILLIFSFQSGIKSQVIKQTIEEPKIEEPKIKDFPTSKSEDFEETEEAPIIDESKMETKVLNKVTILINNLRFYPKEITISPGTTVTWFNNDSAPHKVVAYDRLFYSPRLGPLDKYSFTFTDEGTHSYFDAVFPKVGRGKIIVKEEPLPITGRVIGIDLIKEETNAKFALLVVLFIVVVFGLSHGIYLKK